MARESGFASGFAAADLRSLLFCSVSPIIYDDFKNLTCHYGVRDMRCFFAALILLTFAAMTTGCPQPMSPQATSATTTKSNTKIAVLSITSDPNIDLQKVNMGLTFAGFCVDEGYDVSIFLNVAGVHLATGGFSDELKFKDHAPLKKQLVSLAKRGVQIHVCPVCMKDFEIGNDEIIPEAFVTDKSKLFAKLGADTMIFSY